MPVIVGAVLVVAVVLLAPYLRDGVGALLYRTSTYRDYALLPRNVLIERLQSAEAELERTRYQSVLYESLAGQYASLQSEVGMRPTRAYLTVHVTSRPPRTHYDTLLIAAGTESGVRESDVVTAGGVLLGTVTDVSAASATVELYSSPGSVRDAELGSSIIIVRGLGGGSFEATVPAGSVPEPGTPAHDAVTGLLMATVSSVTIEQTDTSAEVRLASPINLSSLREVSLVHVTDL